MYGTTVTDTLPVPSMATAIMIILAVSNHQSNAEGIFAFTFLESEDTVSVQESAPIGTSVYIASTTLESTELQQFSLEGPSSETFSIANNGAVLTAQRLDCEFQSVHKLLIRSTHPQTEATASMTLIVNVTDVNDNTPIFEQAEYNVQVEAQAGSQVIKLSATDADCSLTNAQITYSLLQADDGGFTINEDSGIVLMPQSPITGHFSFFATAEDQGELDHTASIAVTVYSDCGAVPEIENGNVTLDGDSTSYQANASVACKRGFEPTTSVITCSVHGQWGKAGCVAITCPVLGDPVNGTVSLDGVTVDAVATFECDAGFNLLGSSTAECLTGGSWSSQPPQCQIKDCGNPPSLPNGSVKTDTGNTTFGSTAVYTCDAGYRHVGANSSVCLHNATWETAAPTCVIKDCNIVLAPRHGDVSYTQGTVYGSFAIFTCSPGYTPSHTDRMTCTAAGTWNGSVPSCIIQDCNEVEVPSRASVSYTNNATTYRSNATFTCAPGYSLSHTNTLTCTAFGVWNGSAPNCIIKECEPLQALSKGSISYSNTVPTYGSSATFTCNAGYTLSHTNVLGCAADGTWNGSAPSCNIKVCQALQVPSQASVNYSNNATAYGSSATFTCAPGYNLSHTNALTCTALGVWNGSAPTCIIKECEPLQALSKGSISYSNTVPTYGSSATFTCNAGYTLSHTNVLGCAADGTWNGSAPSCNIKVCQALQVPSQASVSYTNNDTNYGSSATFTCAPGYSLSHTNALTCTALGVWNGSAPTCIIKDCGSLDAPDDGSIDANGGTKYNAKVRYTCNSDFKLYGDVERTCLSAGRWSGLPASCIRESLPVSTCSPNTDTRQTTWEETLPDQTREEECPDGFTGSATRKCSTNGNWETPIYNCEREQVKNIQTKASALTASSTAEEVTSVLQELTDLTSETTGDNVADNELLTHGELSSVASSLADVADIITDDSIGTNVQDGFFEAASNLIDDTNRQTWTTIGDSGGVGAERVIAAVDSVTDVLTQTLLASGDTTTVIAKKNIVVEVKKIADGEDVVFPDQSKNHASWKGSTTSAFLPRAALQGADVVVATGVIFKNMTEMTTAESSSANSRQEINGPVVTMTVSGAPAKLDPKLRLVFEHTVAGMGNPSCSFYQETGNKWSTTGCNVVSTNASMTVCECDHTTNFAVLMSPFVEADADSIALRIVSIVGIGVSIVCLILTLVLHFCLWRYLRSDRTTILMHLCVALLISYVVFLAGVDRTESRAFCSIVAVLLQYIYLVVFCVMLAEGIEIGITVLFVFVKRSRIKPLLIAAWVLPAIIVGISLGVTKAEGYGNDNFCWLSVDSGLIWAFVGPAAAIILFNLVILFIVIKVMFSTKAMEQKKRLKKMKTGIRSLCVLIPLMGTTWIIGIFYINEDFYWIQYIFAICNGLQGFFIFLFHCLLNPQIKNARAAQKRRKSSTTFKSTMRTTSKVESKTSKDYSANDMSNTYLGKNNDSEDDQNYNGTTAQKYLHNSKSEDEPDRFSPPPLGMSNGSNIRLNASSFSSKI